MLVLDRLAKSYVGRAGPVTVLDGFSIRVSGGEVVAVQGPSGSGKTTLLLIAGGLLAPDQGKVIVNGQDLFALGPEARAAYRARTIGFVFQQYHLVPFLTVRENVLASTLAVRVPDASARAGALLDRLDLTGRQNHAATELSTGERQRTALARAMLHRPKVLLADEPTGNLDDGNRTLVTAVVREFAAAGGAVLIATHDMTIAEAANRVVHMMRSEPRPSGSEVGPDPAP